MKQERRSLMLGCDLESLKSSPLRDGHVFSIGPYFPKYNPEHWNSSWSQIVLKAKKNDAWITMVLGQIVAAHLEHWLLRSKQYVMSYVPGKNCITQNLARAVCSNLKASGQVQLETLLVEVRKGQRQHYCSNIRQRIDNVRGRYQVIDSERVRGQDILVIDDIITSGATMRECARVLREYGARSVIGIALARTVGSLN